MVTSRDPWLVSGRVLCVISANLAFYHTFETGPDETVGAPLQCQGNGQWNIAKLRLLFDNVIPKSASVFDCEVGADFPDVGHRTLLGSAQRLQHPDSRQRILLIWIVDATAGRRKEDDKDILLGKRDHCIKNLLSVVQAMTWPTCAAGRTAKALRGNLLGRLEALGRSLEVSGDRNDVSPGALATAS